MTVLPVFPLWALAVLAAIVVGFTVWRIRANRVGKYGRRGWILRGSAMLLLLLAALRPGWPAGESRAVVADLDVFLVVDTSASMAAEDYDGGRIRLEGVRKDIATLGQEFAGAKFALLTFDDSARVRMPLSQDASALATAVDVLAPQPIEYSRGSSVTAAGELLKERLEAARAEHPGRPALVFYFGDGENTSPDRGAPMGTDPGLIDGGAVLGYGTSEGGRMKAPAAGESGEEGSYLKDPASDGSTEAVSRIDEDRLRDIAGELQVPYLHRQADDPTGVMSQEAKAAAFNTRQFSTRDLGDAGGAVRLELYWLFALGAFSLLLGEPLKHATALRNSAALQRSPAARESTAPRESTASQESAAHRGSR
ncbi:VWA domain-containing protein [Arthrobacter sp. ISL-30]|uniref:vWA domain-containing protein n=1 Tax=Arthrobacter sp. ISL-30 TaxID=2819109 RepID=UPI001BE78F31|nr:VWA domain-containing protein [Arthrobacter sp. ISL-30]MBT2513545.1 VWA domain-containing protein [Arthrobacter sp. ISL-30]